MIALHHSTCKYDYVFKEVKDEVLVHIDTPDLEFVLKGSKYDFSDKDCVNLDAFEDNITLTCNKRVYLKEYSNYEVIIRAKNNSSIEFVHENINIRNKVKPVISGFLSGIINFKGDIGFSDLIIKSNNREVFKLTLEVYPSKISYKEDYKALLEDINKEIYNLAYGFLARTYLGSDLNKHKDPSYTEFYSILNYVMGKLLKSIDIITLNPYHELVKSNEVVRYHNIKKSGYDTLRYIERNPKVIRNANGRNIPERAVTSKKQITFDTKENRFAKFMILRIQDKIKAFIKLYAEVKGKSYGKGNYDKEIVRKLMDFNNLLEIKIRNSFFRTVSSEYMESSFSHVFNMSSGYRELYRYYIMLQKGLSIKSNVYSLSMKELSLLYEYWCFIKINSLLQKKYKLLKTDLLKINKDGIVVSLKKGICSKLIYENPKTKERFIVFYNSKKLSKTVSQKPDNILSLYKENSLTSYEFIFDAKYKIDTSYEYKNRHSTCGPKEEDINTMHRYRDAIIYDYEKDKRMYNEAYKDTKETLLEEIIPKEIEVEHKYKNCIFGAFVLFPYNDEEEYKKNTFYKSIEEVNIGGIPFLPSSTTIMEEFLDELINEESNSIFERALHHIGI